MEPDEDVSEQSEPLNSNMQGFWCRKTTLALLQAYEMHNDRLGKDFRFKKYMWQAISLELKKQTGEDFSPAQCENRWRVLYRGYRRAVDDDLKPKKRRTDFGYFDEMRKIVKEYRNVTPVLTLSETGVFACDGKTNLQIQGICSDSKPTPISNTKQYFIISGNPSVNSDRIRVEPESAPSSSTSKQLFIISGQPNVNSDKICSEPKLAASSCGKQLFIISGKPSVNNDAISSEPEPAQNSSAKKIFLINGKSNVISDNISSEPEATPNSNQPLFVSPAKSISPPPTGKKKKLNQSVLEKMRDDRKLYYEKKLEVDKDRVACSENRREELLQLERMKLQQRERLIACEEEKLKCEKEKLMISKEKLKICGRLIQLQEENNEILRSINDKFDFLL